MLDVYALRLVGAAREAAYFATVPFFGAILAVPLLGDQVGPREGVAAVAMALGCSCASGTSIEHAHTHASTTHLHDPPVADGEVHTTVTSTGSLSTAIRTCLTRVTGTS